MQIKVTLMILCSYYLRKACVCLNTRVLISSYNFSEFQNQNLPRGSGTIPDTKKHKLLPKFKDGLFARITGSETAGLTKGRKVMGKRKRWILAEMFLERAN